MQCLLLPESLMGVPFLVAILALVLMFAAALGVNFSLRLSNSLRAIAATMATAVFVGGGYVLLFIPILAAGGSDEGSMIFFSACVPILFMIPLMLADNGPGPGGEMYAVCVFTFMLGTVGYAMAAGMLYQACIGAFQRATGRIEDAGYISMDEIEKARPKPQSKITVRET